MISVENLSKRYASKVAIDGMSFQVEKGEILGFLGPNGAGKTSTMRVITGYMPASGGTVKVDGFDVADQPLEVRRRIGYLPENPPLYPEMTVIGYLQFVAKLKGVSSSALRDEVHRVMDKVNVVDVKDRIIAKLSKGYKQRVGIAQALLNDPPVLILDEPTIGLDPKQIQEVRELVKGLAGSHTVVLSTHILPEVEQTCHRVIIIDKGKIVAVDTPQNLRSQIQGAARIFIEVDGPPSDVADTIRALPGVLGVSMASEPGNRSRFQIDSETGRDVRIDLARTVVNKGWGLLELHSETMSLEDIFIKLTTAEETAASVSSIMRNIFVIAERELKTYFISPVAYVVLTFFIFISGVFFSAILGGMMQSVSSRAIMAAQTGQPPPPVDMPGQIAQQFFGTTSFLMLFMLPMITMALFSEEKKRGTIELLLTAPVTDLEVVLGKFAAAAGFYTILLSTTVVEMAALYYFSSPASGPILSAYLGMLLYGLAVIAIGMFISTLTESQIVAAVLSFGTVFVLWLIEIFARNASEGVKAVLLYLSVIDHMQDFIMGVVGTSHIIFYLSLTLVGLFLTYRSLDSLRWRG